MRRAERRHSLEPAANNSGSRRTTTCSPCISVNVSERPWTPKDLLAEREGFAFWGGVGHVVPGQDLFRAAAGTPRREQPGSNAVPLEDFLKQRGDPSRASP
jgi:hypothetical protein